MIEDAGSRIAGHVDIRPAIVIVIQREYAERVVALGSADAGGRADVGKRAVAVVVIEIIHRCRKTARPARDRNPFVLAIFARAGLRHMGEIRAEVHVVGDEQVNFAIAVVIDECAA